MAGTFVGSSLLKKTLISISALLLLVITSNTCRAQTLAQVVFDNDLGIFFLAVGAAGLIDVLQQEGADMSTILAPTNVAFGASLPTGALPYLLQSENRNILGQLVSYHILSGVVVQSTDLTDGLVVQDKTFNIKADGNFTINGVATIGPTDLQASNGVLHIIDKVLVPPQLPSFPPNLIERAEELGLFSELLAVIQVAGLVDTFTNGGMITAFAPYDAAFSKLPVGSLTFLLRHPSILERILLYHVSEGLIEVLPLIDGQSQSVSTLLEDEELEISFELGANGFMFSVNDGEAAVVIPDLAGLNGLLQVIDTVLIPPGVEITPSIADVAFEMNVFQSLFDAFETVGFDITTLNEPGPFST
jgi:transforming growth factor-beta-induced protein